MFGGYLPFVWGMLGACLGACLGHARTKSTPQNKKYKERHHRSGFGGMRDEGEKEREGSGRRERERDRVREESGVRGERESEG